MGFMFLIKNIGLLFLLVSSSLLSTCSFAGRHHRLVDNLQIKALATNDNKEVKSEDSSHGERVEIIHERLLKVNTKDYGTYDPAPALGKPPFKLIPN